MFVVFLLLIEHQRVVQAGDCMHRLAHFEAISLLCVL